MEKQNHPSPTANLAGIRLTPDFVQARLTPLRWRPQADWQRYLAGFVLITLATAAGVLVNPFISPSNLVTIYLLAVVMASIYLGRGPAVLVSLLSVLAFDFFIVPPRLTFAVSDTQYLLTFFGLLVVGLVITQLTARLHEQVETAERRELQVSILYTLSRDLAVAANMNEIMRAIVENVSQTFERQVVILLPSGEDKTLQVSAASRELELDKNEMAIATWAFEHGEPAGRNTGALPGARARYLPLKSTRGILGVMGIAPAGTRRALNLQQNRILESFASLAALAIERAQLQETARNAQLLAATEKLQSALLNSISHDLRTPLVSITGVLTSLQDEPTQLDDATRQSLIETAREEADRLNRLVGNLLDMTRIEAGAVKVEWEPCDMQDLISTALEQAGSRMRQRPVVVEIPEDMPLVALDLGLLVQVLVKLIDNADKYSPPGAPIEIRAGLTEDAIEIDVADRGIGIPPEDLARVFDKFYRVHRPNSVGGTGMGLSICKGIVEAHGGSIRAENRADGGTRVRIRLPRHAMALPGGAAQ
ncbi:MAG: ATP-binding protein [Anaerolineae bacterium]